MAMLRSQRLTAGVVNAAQRETEVKVYQCPQERRAIIRDIRLTNSYEIDGSVFITVTVSGLEPPQVRLGMFDIPPFSTLSMAGDVILHPGDGLYLYSYTDGLSYYFSGAEVLIPAS